MTLGSDMALTAVRFSPGGPAGLLRVLWAGV